MSIEDELKSCLKKASEERGKRTFYGYSGFYNDQFPELDEFILRVLKIGKNEDIQVIVDNMDIILPFIVDSNVYKILNNNVLVKQDGFREKFGEGLKKYPYKNFIIKLFFPINICYSGFLSDFLDKNLLEIVSSLKLDTDFNEYILNRVDKEKQKFYLKSIIDYGGDFIYSNINFFCGNRKIIFENIDKVLINSSNLYALRSFVQGDYNTLNTVKEYINSHEKQAVDSIFNEIKDRVIVSDSSTKDVIILLINEILNEEKVCFSDIEFDGGGFSKVLFIGDKVLKLGDRYTKSFPNNPYIVAPLFRREIISKCGSCFIEVTERVDTSVKPNRDDMFKIHCALGDLDLELTDCRPENFGRLLKPNVLHWKEDINPTDESLELDSKRGNIVLDAGDWVILDADYIFDVNTPKEEVSVPCSQTYAFREQYRKMKSNKKSDG